MRNKTGEVRSEQSPTDRRSYVDEGKGVVQFSADGADGTGGQDRQDKQDDGERGRGETKAEGNE